MKIELKTCCVKLPVLGWHPWKIGLAGDTYLECVPCKNKVYLETPEGTDKVTLSYLFEKWNDHIEQINEEKQKEKYHPLNQAKKMLKLLTRCAPWDIDTFSAMQESTIDTECQKCGVKANIKNYREIFIKGLEAYIKEETEND